MKLLCLLLVFASGSWAFDEGWVTHAIALSPDQKTIVRGRMHAELGTSRLRLIDARTNKLRLELKGPGPIRAFAFRPDGKRFVATNDHGPLQVRDTATGKKLVELAGHRGWVYSVAFAGGRVASAARDDTIRVWDAKTGKPLWSEPKARAGAVALSPDGKTLATTDRFGRVLLWDAATGKRGRRLDTGDNRWGFVVAFSRDGKRVVAGSRSVRIFDVESGSIVSTIGVHTKPIRVIAFAAEGAKLVTADVDRVIRVWRIKDATPERTWKVSQSVGALVVSPKGDTLAAATNYGKCHFWNLSTGKTIPEPQAPKPK